MGSYGMLFVQGQDRPGIVKTVTEIFYQSGVNLEDVSMSLLEGQFAMMLSFKNSSPKTLNALKNKIEILKQKPWNLFVQLISIASQKKKSANAGRSILVSAIGKDRTGIVFGLSSALAKLKANITNLDCRLLHQKSGQNLYSLALGVDLKKSSDFKAVNQLIPVWRKKLGIEVRIHSSEAAVF